MCVARQAQITQSNKVAILQYLKKEVIDEVDFLHADKQKLPTTSCNDFEVDGQAFPKFPA